MYKATTKHDNHGFNHFEVCYIVYISFVCVFGIIQVFDKSGCGYICASDIRAILQCLGEDLTEEESKICHQLL